MQWYVYLIMIPAALFLGQIAIELLGQPIQAILRLRHRALERLLAFRDVALPKPRETSGHLPADSRARLGCAKRSTGPTHFWRSWRSALGLERNRTCRLRPDDPLWPRHRAGRPRTDQPLAGLCRDEMRQRRGASGHRRSTSRGKLRAYRFSPAFRWRQADENSARADVSARYAFTPAATAARPASRNGSPLPRPIPACGEAFGTIRKIEVCV